MTDGDLASAHGAVSALERAVRADLGQDAGEREAVATAYRHVVALRRALGEWIVARATAAHQAAAVRQED